MPFYFICHIQKRLGQEILLNINVNYVITCFYNKVHIHFFYYFIKCVIFWRLEIFIRCSSSFSFSGSINCGIFCKITIHFFVFMFENCCSYNYNIITNNRTINKFMCIVNNNTELIPKINIII